MDKEDFVVPENLEHQRDFIEAGYKMGLLVAKKNSDYGSAFEQVTQILKILYPNGIPVHQYENASLLIRMFDKVGRIANENVQFYNEDSWKDLVGYSLIKLVKNSKEKD